MRVKRIGTIIHGALGDCYEQICSIKILQEKGNVGSWIAFFVDERQLKIMQHFDLSCFAEIHLFSNIEQVNIDEFFQFQINDLELQRDYLSKLSSKTINRFPKTNFKPWEVIRMYNFSERSLELGLSSIGEKYLPECEKNNNIDLSVFKRKMTVGYLWRYRTGAEAVAPFGQHTKEWIIQTKSLLFKRLISEYNAHIFIAGMAKQDTIDVVRTLSKGGGFLPGEYKHKYTDLVLDIPPENCTYLKGIGYAAELEIMARCDLLLMMPSGFSEILWMKKKQPVILIDSPPSYLLKLFVYQMPLFNNREYEYFKFNNFMSHTDGNIYLFLKKQKII